MTEYRHNRIVLVSVPDTDGLPDWEVGRIDTNLHPAERLRMPPGHHCVRFEDGGRMLFAEHNMRLTTEVTR